MTKTKKQTTKIKTKTKTKINNINVYGHHTYYMRNDSNSNKMLISQLTNVLKENQWLKVSYEKYKPIKQNNPKSYFKPQGSYYSKGGWLFHEVCCNLDNEIILIEVDYSTIYRITGKTPYTQTNSNSVYKQNMNKFINTYGTKLNKYSCDIKNDFFFNSKKHNSKKHNNKIEQIKCDSYKEKNKCVSNRKCKWNKMFKTFKYPYKTHNGFAIYPLPSYKWLHKKIMDRLVFNSLDVETLVLWNHKPVIKHYNLGTIREIIGDNIDNNIDNKTKENDFTTYLIPKLIEIVNKINN